MGVDQIRGGAEKLEDEADGRSDSTPLRGHRPTASTRSATWVEAGLYEAGELWSRMHQWLPKPSLRMLPSINEPSGRRALLFSRPFLLDPLETRGRHREISPAGTGT